MLIEAAKGGHAQIVSLLLDWSAMLSSNPSLSEKLKVLFDCLSRFLHLCNMS